MNRDQMSSFTYLCLMVAVLAAWGLMVSATANLSHPQAPTWTKTMPADRATPASILITKDVPESAYVCAELPNRSAACRRVGEVRAFLKQAPKAK